MPNENGNKFTPEYRTQLDHFLEVNYKKFLSYALHQCKGDDEKAVLLLHDTCRHLLEGKAIIDFGRSNGRFTLVQFIMKSIRHHQGTNFQLSFENGYVLTRDKEKGGKLIPNNVKGQLSDESLHQVGYIPHEMTHSYIQSDILHKAVQLLKPREKAMIETIIHGGMINEFNNHAYNTSVGRVYSETGYSRLRARSIRRLKAQVKILLQDAE